MNGNGTLVETMTHSSLYSDYSRAYTEVTGLPVALRPVETWQLPLHGKHKENRFCGLLASKSRTCAACLQLQAKLSQGAMEQPCTLTCPYGLSETAVPVRLGSETLGFLQTGQVFRQKPTNVQFARVAERVGKLDLDLDLQELKPAYFETPVASQARMDSVTNLLFLFADHLSMKSNQIALLEASAEPTVICNARKFIEEHHPEDLSLGQVSKAVNTSRFYFCKLFRKVTGLGFTEYVSRTRIEKTKHLLLNRNLRVSEIAYEAGFKSLTHFNRTFKRMAGESPTEYRAHLPTISSQASTSAAIRKRTRLTGQHRRLLRLGCFAPATRWTMTQPTPGRVALGLPRPAEVQKSVA